MLAIYFFTIQFNPGSRLPKLLFLVWTPSFTSVWTKEVDEELLAEIMTVLWEVFFCKEVGLEQIIFYFRTP